MAGILNQVGIMANPMDIASFEAIETLVCEADRYVHHTVSFVGYNGMGHFVAIRILSKEMALYIDDIRLRTAEECPAVLDIAVGALTPGTIQVCWMSEGRASSGSRGYELRLSPLHGGVPMAISPHGVIRWYRG